MEILMLISLTELLLKQMPRIRKLSIGVDYKNGIHFSLGQSVWDGHTICDIHWDEGIKKYVISIEDKDGNVKTWKRFNGYMGSSEELDITNY